MLNNEQLRRFETNLQQELLRVATSCGMLDRVLLATDDIDEHWKRLASEYMADAVPQVQQYPTVSVAWAGYLGMGVAHLWDESWEYYALKPYTIFHGKQGFDDMDEHILEKIMGLSLTSEEARRLENVMRRLAETAIQHIRREQIEPSPPMAFHAFARACKAVYRVGAAIELKRLGDKFEEMSL